jgi:hypothetical protein
MDAQFTGLPSRASEIYQRGRELASRVPSKAWVVVGLFFIAAILMALYTAMSSKDAYLRLNLQHNFHDADVSVWVDDDRVYSGKLHGVSRKKFGILNEGVHGSLSESIAVPSGKHRVRVQVTSDQGAVEDSVNGELIKNHEVNLLATARSSGVSLTWEGAAQSESPSDGPGWLARYASTLLLSVGGSIISALTGFAIKEVPARLKNRQTPEAKTQSAAAGQ